MDEPRHRTPSEVVARIAGGTIGLTIWILGILALSSGREVAGPAGISIAQAWVGARR